MAITITRTGANTVIAQTGLADINISASTEVEITYNDAEEFINILLVASTEPPIALEVAEITTVNGVDVTGYTIAQLAAYISANCFGVFDEVAGDFVVTGSLTSGQHTITSGNNLRITAGDLQILSNAGFGILSANGNRVVSIQNGVFGVNATKINFTGLPTSSAGLVSGDLWNDGGTLKIV